MVCSQNIHIHQGLSVLYMLGIAGYEWVPARIGHFYKYNFFFIMPMANKNRKNWYSFVSWHFPCSVFPVFIIDEPPCFQRWEAVQCTAFQGFSLLVFSVSIWYKTRVLYLRNFRKTLTKILAKQTFTFSKLIFYLYLKPNS